MSTPYRSAMTRILVTGGAGYVGSVSVEALLAAGHEVVVLDDLTTGHRGGGPGRGAASTRAPTRTRPSLAGLLEAERIEAILHCAARSLVGESIATRRSTTATTSPAAWPSSRPRATAGVERIVFSSTAAVYGVPDATPIPEDAPLRPINPYGEIEADVRGRAAPGTAGPTGLRSVSLRYFNVAGATEALGEDHDPETHLIPNVLAAAEGTRAADGLRRRLPDPDGTCIRDYIHVADLADAHLRAHRGDRARRSAHGRAARLQPGHGGGFSVREVARRRRARRRAAHPVRRWASAGPAIRRSSSPSSTRAADGPGLATGARDPASTRWSGRPGPGASATRRLPGLTRQRLARLQRRRPRREPLGRARSGPSRPRRRSRPSPAQSSRTGQISHSPMSIVTSRLSTATW